MIRTSLFALLAGATMAAATFAQDAAPEALPSQQTQEAQGDAASRPDRPNLLMRLDADGDGQITREEAENPAAARFARMDANGDGTVDRAEAVAFAESEAAERAGAMFDRIDEDGDGEIAEGDLPERNGRGDRIDRLFERVDADDDGVLSADELAEMEPMRGHHGKRGGHGHHGGDHDGGRHSDDRG